MAAERFDITRLEGPDEEYGFTVGPDDGGGRLDAVLGRRYKWLSRTEARKLIDRGRVFVERGGGDECRIAKASFRVSLGDKVRMGRPRSPQDGGLVLAAPPDLRILFEDDVLLVVDKPSGLPVHPVGGNLYRTVLFALHERCREAAGAGSGKEASGESMPHLAHRLDAETSGDLLAVKGRSAMRDVAEQFRNRSVRKEYSALVYGAPEKDRGTIDLPLGAEKNSRVPYKQAVRSDGAPARTRYVVEQRGRRASMVRLFPETGRKHQLRLHMAAIGHAIVGDKVYGPGEEHYFKAREGPPVGKDLEELILPRLGLHSSLLGIRHPRSGEEVVFEAPLPAELAAIS